MSWGRVRILGNAGVGGVGGTTGQRAWPGWLGKARFHWSCVDVRWQEQYRPQTCVLISSGDSGPLGREHRVGTASYERPRDPRTSRAHIRWWAGVGCPDWRHEGQCEGAGTPVLNQQETDRHGGDEVGWERWGQKGSRDTGHQGADPRVFPRPLGPAHSPHGLSSRSESLPGVVSHWLPSKYCQLTAQIAFLISPVVKSWKLGAVEITRYLHCVKHCCVAIET